jgi:hypothetical protein
MDNPDLTQVVRETTAVPSRRSSRMRFEMNRGRRGWKIIDFRQKEFFQ